jgi:hypothetical protein
MNIGLNTLNKINSNTQPKEKDPFALEEEDIYQSYKQSEKEKIEKQSFKDSNKEGFLEEKTTEKSISSNKASNLSKENVENTKQAQVPNQVIQNPESNDLAIKKMMQLRTEQRAIRDQQYKKEGLAIYTDEMKNDLRRQGRRILSPL